MQVRIIRPVVVIVALGIAAAGCGRYSISNIRSAKAFQDANNLYKKADYKGAVTRYEDSIQLNPELGFAYFFLGNSYENLHKPSKGDDPENIGYLTKAGEHYRMAIDKLETATDPKQKLIRRYAFEYLIVLYGADKLNNFEKAEEAAKQLIAADPTDSATYQMLARLYEDQGMFEEGEAQLLKAIEVSPKEPAGYQILANFYNTQGEFDKTMAAWYKRAEIEPNNPEAWHTIAAFYQDKVLRDKKLTRQQALDFIAKGLEAVEKALAINPKYYEAVTYKNILFRQQALFEKDPAKQKQLLSDADVLYKRALDLRAAQQTAGTDIAAAKKGGS